MPSVGMRFQNAWNAFMNKDPTRIDVGQLSTYNPNRPFLSRRADRSIVTAIYNHIAVDVSAVNIEHVLLDENGRFKETVDSSLNSCLTLEANKDQTGKAFMRDVVLSMFDEGVIAIVPVDTKSNPLETDSYDILSLRTGKITAWFPDHVRVELYNDRSGRKEEITLPKRMVAVVENPFYSTMNGPNSTLQRLIRKLSLLDYVDEQSGSGKLDLIIQLPGPIRSPVRKAQAEERRKDIEMQLAGSKYGIAYVDSTEHITQLNRAVENNIWNEVKDLTSMLYNQLGLTEAVLDGTADEKTMINYYNRTIDPILSAIADEMQRKFLTQNARTRGQAIRYFRDPFRLVPVSDIAEIADKFTRNAILSSNELRAEIGYKPSDDPRADELSNKNLNQSNEELKAYGPPNSSEGEIQNE